MAIVAKNLSYGPKRIVTDGLVLYLDPSNPETYTPSSGRNFHPNPTDIFAWSGTGANAATLSRDTISSPVGSTPLKMVTTGNDSHTFTYLSSTWNIADASMGQTWTVSVYAKADRNTTGQIFIFETTNAGTSFLVNRQRTFNITTEWQRFDYTVTFTNASTTKLQIRLDGRDIFDGATIWWDGLQVELSPSVTEFTTSPPTNPTYITDLSFNKKIGTVNTTGFVRNSFDFDGINDTLDLSSSYGTTIQNNFTVDFWCIPRTTHQIDSETNNTLITSGTSGQRYLMDAELISVGSGSGISAGTNGISVYEHSASYMPPLLVYSSTISSTSYSHVVVTYTNKQPRLYLNGQLVRTGLQSLRSFVALGGGKIGYGQYGYFNGLVGMVKYYNRTLSLLEIQQNFNAHRTRFGL
jgi:hypothetical protein